MFLLLISGIVTIVGVIGHCVFKHLAKHHQSKYAEFSDASENFDTIGFVCGVTTIILLIFVVVTTAAGVIELTRKEQQYEVLSYQLDNGLYDSANGIGKRELYEEIEEYNVNVAIGKKIQENPWLNIFTARIYDQLELIELPVVESVE